MIVSSVSKTLTNASWDVIYNKQKDNDQTLVSNPYEKSAIAYVCISTTATAIGQVPLLVMRKGKEPPKDLRRQKLFKRDDNIYFIQKDNPFDKTIVIEKKADGSLVTWEAVLDSDPWQTLFNSPNYLLSSTQMKEALVSLYLLNGNVWIVGMPLSVNVIPDSLFVVNERTMRPKRDSKTGHLVAWEYDPRGFEAFSSVDMQFSKMNIAIDERICHIKKWNPSDPIMGLSPFKAAKIPLKADWKAAMYNEKFLDGDGVINGAVMTDQKMQPEQIKQFKQQWREQHGGYENSNNIAVFHNGLKYQSFGVSHQDMQYIDLRKFSRDEIIQILGMKKAVISITEELNYATHIGQIKSWWQSTNIPICKAIEDSISWQFLKNDPNIKIIHDISVVSALQDDFKEKTEIAQKYWQMGLSFDAINERLGLGFDAGMPGADVGYLPLSYMPVGFNDMREEIPPPKELISNEIKYIDIVTSAERKQVAFEKYAEPIWKIVDNQVGRIEKPYERKVQRVFFDLRKNLLSVFNTGKPHKSKNSTILKRETSQAIDDINAYTCILEKVLLAEYSQGYFDLSVMHGVDTIVEQLHDGDRINNIDPLIADYISAKKTKIVSVIDTVKKEIEKQMRIGAAEGEDVVKLEQRIKTVMGVADRRAHVIARTEMGGSMNFGRYAQLNRCSFKYKLWFTALDERVRGAEGERVEFDHAAMHGQQLLISPTSQWNVGGELLDYPGDYKGSAANIIQCRCIEVADIEGEY